MRPIKPLYVEPPIVYQQSFDVDKLLNWILWGNPEGKMNFKSDKE